MPGITDPSEEYFKDGIWGWATSAWEKLHAFANLLGVAGHGWDGSDWRKLALVWGYSDQYLERESDTGDGSNLTQDLTVVPSGEVWVVTAFVCNPVSGDHADFVRLGIYDGSNFLWFGGAASLNQLVVFECPTPLVLAEGDRLRIIWTDAANGDTFHAYANGYKMKIAE